ncbi:hypothetical protein ACSBR1_041713 [Camellia fascicularis]
MTSKYATPTTNELGIQIRSLCPIKDVKSWLDLDETTKSAVIQAILVIDITCPQDIVNKKAYGLYKDWRYTLKQEFKLLEGIPSDEIYAHPPLGKQSKAGKSNRSQLPYNHTNGSRSFPIAMAAMQEMVNVQATTIESGTPLTQEELSRQVLGQNKRYLLGFGSGPQPSTIAASRARDKDIEALCEERQKDHDELMKEREERERYYNEMLKKREERIQLANEMLKEREEGQKAREETNTKVEHLNNVVAKLSLLLGI